MAERDTRIRWTGKERDIVVGEYQSLCASNSNLPMMELLVAAQKGLPKERQRPPSYALRAWFNKELKAKLDAGGRRDARQAAAGAGAEAMTVTAGLGGDAGGQSWASAPVLQQLLPAAIRSAMRAPVTPEELKILTEAVVEMTIAVLSNARVRQAVRSVLQSRDDEPFLAPRTTFQTAGSAVVKMKMPVVDPPSSQPMTAQGPRSGKMRVLIAGPAGGQLTEVSAPYADELELESWSPDQGFEQLRTLVDNVDVVIGMPSMLTQAVQNTLRHYSKRYVRHTAGIAGLGGELGKLVPQEAK